MFFNEETILAIQNKTRFIPENIEKVLRLLEILNGIFADEELGKFYALKGGTALNLFYFNIPRLSVDIDLNFIGTADREEMLAKKGEHEARFQQLFLSKGYSIKKTPEEHAGGKWRLRYKNFMGQDQNLEVDINYMLRIPLLPPEIRDSNDFGGYRAKNIRLLDVHELAAGKFCALLSRCKPRDLFDAHLLLHEIGLEPQKLRECFTVYAAFNIDDFSRINSLEELKFDLAQFKAQLIATLPVDSVPMSSKKYLDKLITECREKLKVILPFSPAEKKFLKSVNQVGEVLPDLISADPVMQEKIKKQPMLMWKTLNVKNYRAMKK